MRVVKTIVLLALVALTVTSYAFASEPTRSQIAPTTTVRPHEGAPRPLPTNTPTAVPVQTVTRVTDPWQPGEFQKGVQIYWHYVASDVDVTDKASKLLDYIVGLHANSVAISFPIYTDGATPTRVYTDTDTPSVQQLGIILDQANRRGLRVTIRPLIYEANIVEEDPMAWRGNIQVSDVGAWFASYDEVILSYVQLASQYKVDEIVAGTELVSMQPYGDHWNDLKSKIQAAGFEGVISYATNWSSSVNDVFQIHGVDAYPAVDLGDDATVEQLRDEISRWIVGAFTEDVRSRLTVQEVGIPALRGVYQRPWGWGMGSNQTLDFTIQANWFSAFCQATHATNLQGIYYWALDTNIDFATSNPNTDYSASFYGRPAANSIMECFSS